jgi:hypothetical protein
MEYALVKSHTTFHADYPSGVSSNEVVEKSICKSEKDAVLYFQEKYPNLNLNKNGYSKIGETTYCVASVWA